MDDVGFALVRLATSTTRTNVLTPAACEHIASVLLGEDFSRFQGPFGPVFDEFALGVPYLPTSAAEVALAQPNGSPWVSGRIRLTGLGSSAPVRIDALWRGGLTATTSTSDSRIEKVSSETLQLSQIDPRIVKRLGALPALPATLEQERRAELLSMLNQVASPNTHWTDAGIEKILTSLHATSVGEAIQLQSQISAVESLRIVFSNPTQTLQRTTILPVCAALLVRSAQTSLAELLQETRTAEAWLNERGFGVAKASGLTRTHLMVVWVVPITLFDDADWPGAQLNASPAAAREQRRQVAAKWLAQQGIGLAVFDRSV